MTKAGRGEGLAGLRRWANIGSPNGLMQEHPLGEFILRAEALEAAAPPSTARELWESAKQRELLAMKIAEDLMAQNMLDVPCKVALHVINAALATPSPQAPEVEAIDDRAKVGRALNALDHLCDMWAEEVDLERIVKAISGNPDKVRALLRQSWIEGAYRGRTSHVDCPQPVSPAATQEQPAGSIPKIPDAPDTRHAIYHSAEFERGVMSRAEWTDALHATYFALFGKQAPESMKACDISHAIVDFKLPGSPRKVGGDGAKVGDGVWVRGKLLRVDKGYLLVEVCDGGDSFDLLCRPLDVRSSSVPVGEQK